MKTYYKEELEIIRLGLVQMKSNYLDAKLEDLDQDILDQLVLLLNIITEEYSNENNSTFDLIGHQNIDDMDDEELNSLLELIIDISESLYEIAKTRVKDV